jgi:integrase
MQDLDPVPPVTFSSSPGQDLKLVSATGKPVELRIPGRDLATDAARATAGETFSQADYELMERGVRPKTRKTLKEAWKRVLDFTSGERVAAGGTSYLEVPMPEATCVKMIDWCWLQKGKRGQPYAPATVRGMMWAVTKAHQVARRPDGTRGYPTPVESVEVRKAYAGYVAKYVGAKHRSHKASPISPEEAIAMIRTCDTRSVIGLRDALAIAFLYDGWFRAGELVEPKEFGEEEGRFGIEFEHVELHVRDAIDWAAVDWRRPEDIRLFTSPEEGDVNRIDHLVVRIPMSKTFKEGDGDEVILPAHPDRYAFNCPVRLYIAWVKLLRELELPRRGPMLRNIRTGNRAPQDGRPKKGTVTEQGLRYVVLAGMYQRWVAAAGIEDPAGAIRHFSLHGMRAGGAEAAADAGADTPEMNRHARWSQFGTTAQRYAARALKRKRNPARRIWLGGS